MLFDGPYDSYRKGEKVSLERNYYKSLSKEGVNYLQEDFHSISIEITGKTFAIKEELKKLGFRYHSSKKWFKVQEKNVNVLEKIAELSDKITIYFVKNIKYKSRMRVPDSEFHLVPDHVKNMSCITF